MGELQVALGASRVETDERLSLLLGFSSGCLLSDEHPRLVLDWLSHLRNDEGRVGGHGHLPWRGSLEFVGIGWESSVVCHQLERDCDGFGGGLMLLKMALVVRMVLLNVQLGLRLRVGVGEHGLGHTVASVHARDGLLWRDGRKVLQRQGSRGAVAHVGDRSAYGRWELRELMVGVYQWRHHGHLVRSLDVREGWLWWSGRGVNHVVGAQLVIRDGRTRVHGRRVGGRGELLVLQRKGGLDAEEFGAGLID